MPGLADYAAQNALNYLTGGAAMPVVPALYLGLFTAAPTNDAGAGGTEASGGAYVRVQVAGSATTNNTTAAGVAILHFSATPSWIVAGMTVRDTTTPSAIPVNTTVLSVAGATVTMSANAAGAGVGAGDSLTFSAWPAASASSGSEPAVVPVQATNGAVITFPGATANWGAVLAFGLYDASNSGNLLWWDYLGAYSWLAASVSAASPGVLTTHAHGYLVNDTVVVSTKIAGGVPSFSQSNFTGPLVVAHAATDTFDVTNASTAVNTSTTGDVLVRKVSAQSIPSGVTASFAAASFSLALG